MMLTQDYIQASIPRGYPPREYIPQVILESPLAIRQDILSRSLLWTSAISSELRKRVWQVRSLNVEKRKPLSEREMVRLLENIPHVEIAIGLLDPEYETRGFGVIVNSMHGEVDDELCAELFFPRLDAAFPIVVNKTEGIPHLSVPSSLNVHPGGGCRTCWAIDRTTTQRGILTAKHCTNGFPVNSPFPLSPHGSGIVRKKGAGIIDAAFVSLEGCRSISSRSQLTVLPYPTSGTPVIFHFPSGQIHATIKAVVDQMGIIDDHLLQINVYTDAYGVDGQSGSLLATLNGEGVGIYSGRCISKNGLFGRSQHLEQARILLDLNLYH